MSLGRDGGGDIPHGQKQGSRSRRVRWCWDGLLLNLTYFSLNGGWGSRQFVCILKVYLISVRLFSFIINCPEPFGEGSQPH